MMKHHSKEMALLRSLSRHEARKLGCGAIVAGCCLLFIFFFAVFDAILGPVQNYKLKLTVGSSQFMAKIESPRIQQSYRVQSEELRLSADGVEMENRNTTENYQPEELKPSADSLEMESNQTVKLESSSGASNKNLTIIEGKGQSESGKLNFTRVSSNMTTTRNPQREGKEQSIHACDFSHPKSDVCYIEGDIRIHKNTSTIFFVNPQFQIPADGFWKIRPYARKTDLRAMSGVTELKVKPLLNPQELPSCSVRHSVPGLVFSTGGYNGNLFHDFTDVIIPLFLTSHHHNGEVRLINTNGHSWWTNKFGKILKQLSHYNIIDYDSDDRVHCFTKLRVGLTVHKEFSIDPAIKSFNGYTSMQEFRKLMMDSFQLKRDIGLPEMKRPRLLMLSRSGTRRIINLNQIIKLSKRLGYDVVVADDLMTRSLAKFSEVVNSCDVMMGVHGAGLTNMVFLPAGAVVIQIVPFGRLDWISHVFFAGPAKDMKFNYIEYDINVEESTLIYQFPKDDPVIKDPLSIHKKGWNTVEEIYLKKQDVRLDLKRFKGVLENAHDFVLRKS